MRKLLIILFLGVCITGFAKDKKKKILIYPFYYEELCNADAIYSFGDNLCKELASAIGKELPCFDIATRSDIVTMLENARYNEINFGHVDNDILPDAANKLDADYVIALTIRCYGNNSFLVSGTMRKGGDVKPQNRLSRIGDPSTNDFINQYAKDFLEDILYSEPCPYKGKIKIEDLEAKSVDSSYTKNILCGDLANNKGTEEHVYKETRNVNRKISLNKIKRLEAEGTFTSDMTNDIYSKYVNNDCYVCVMDGTDATVKTTGDFSSEETQKLQWNISGIASFQDSDKYTKASEVELHFERNGTYTVEVKALSEYGAFSGSKIEKTNSTCAGQNSKKDEISYKINDIFKYSLGPFKGTPYDKELKENGSTNYNDNANKEKHKIAYEFNFSR